MSGTANVLTENASITGTGILRLNADSMLAIRNGNKLDTDITIAGSGLLAVQEGTFTLSENARFDGAAVAVGPPRWTWAPHAIPWWAACWGKAP